MGKSGKESRKCGDDSAIRQAEPSDFEGVMAIENACFPGELAYTRAQMRYLLFKANGITLVETSGTEVRGYITMVFRRNTETACLETIGVLPACRGTGVGKRLLRAAEEWMLTNGITSFRLEVSSGNSAAISMYEKAGYRITGILPNYYIYDHNGTRDAFRMEKHIESCKT